MARAYQPGAFYERELKYRLKKTTDMFEPAILLIVGGLVAALEVVVGIAGDGADLDHLTRAVDVDRRPLGQDDAA